MNPYRCKLGGLLGIGIGISSTHFMLTACNNLEALRKITASHAKVKTTWTSVDLITQILDIWQHRHCQPTPQHVYGHQGDKHMGLLPFVEHLNIRTDKLAKSIAIRGFGTVPPLLLALGKSLSKAFLWHLSFKNHSAIQFTLMQWWNFLPPNGK